MRRVGVLSPSADFFLNAFRQGLREMNYIEGRNISLEYRSAEGRANRLFDLSSPEGARYSGYNVARCPRRETGHQYNSDCHGEC